MSSAAWTLRDRKLALLVWGPTLLFAGLAVGMLIATPFHAKPYQNTLGAAAWSALAAFAFARARRIRVEVDANGITIVRYFTQQAILWSDLADVRVGYGGMWLTLANGTRIKVPGMGDGLLATVRKTRTQIDSQVERLRHEIIERNGRASA